MNDWCNVIGRVVSEPMALDGGTPAPKNHCKAVGIGGLPGHE